MWTTYNDLYDYDWNLDGTVTRAIFNKRYRIGLDANIARAPWLAVKGPNNPNIVRDDQDDLIKYYKNKYEGDTRVFL